MGKNKLEKFADMASYPHVFEYPYSAVDNVPFEMKGNWHQQFFKNDNPIVLELGCGRGEYTVGLGRMFPDKNFIGVIVGYKDIVIKGYLDSVYQEECDIGVGVIPEAFYVSKRAKETVKCAVVYYANNMKHYVPLEDILEVIL